MKARPDSVFRIAAPLRGLFNRFTIVGLLGLCFGLILLSRGEVGVIERVRTGVADLMSPVLAVLASPVEAAGDAADSVRSLIRLRSEHALLVEEVRRLEQWQDVARKLDTENRSLRALLNFTPEPHATSTAARIIADSGGAFARNVLVAAGAGDGVAKGHTAMTGEGLVGRVTEVGERTSRVLLITDLNSHVPVIVEGSRERAVLAGDNTATPRLLYLPQGARVARGDRVVTSGHGGGFPPGLPVGTVVSATEHGVLIQPHVDWAHLDYLRLVDYGLNDLLPAPTSPPPPRGVKR